MPNSHIINVSDKSTTLSNQKAGLIFNDSKSMFLYRKVERLMSATYMISNLMSDNEPIKWRLREHSICLLDKVLDFGTELSLKAKTNLMSEIVSLSLKIISFFETARFVNLMSEMNFSILKAEFSNFIDSLKNSYQGIENSSVLPTGFLTDKGAGIETLESLNYLDFAKKTSSGESYKGHKGYKGQVAIKDSNYRESSPLKNQSNKDNIKKDKIKAKNNRKDSILSILKTKDNLSIKDFSLIIKDCSEKTIQRELGEFLRAGLVFKEGDRRWSRYSIAQKV